MKAKRKAISLDTKMKILDQLATGQGATAVGKQFGIHESTIRSIKKNETAIRQSVCSGTKISVKSTSYIRDVRKEKMERVLVMWIEDRLQKRIPVDGITIKQTALRIYKYLKEKDSHVPSKSKQPEFAASTGWMTGFLKRHALNNIKLKGEGEIVGEVCTDMSCTDLEELVDKSLCESEIIDLTPETDLEREPSDNGEDSPALCAALIKEGLDLARELGNYFELNDPDEGRSGEFQRKLKLAIAPYRKLYKSLSQNERQPLMNEFFPKTVLITQETRDDNPEIISEDK